VDNGDKTVYNLINRLLSCGKRDFCHGNVYSKAVLFTIASTFRQFQSLFIAPTFASKVAAIM